MKTARLLYALMILVFAVTIAAQDSQIIKLSETADSLYRAEQWQAAAGKYEELTETDPLNGVAWFRLGSSLYQIGKYDRAIEAFNEAENIGQYLPFTRYNLASLHALKQQPERALGWLEKSIEAGYVNVEAIRADSDLVVLHGNPRFNELMTMAEKKARPCQFDDRYKVLDFWVGSWDVYTQEGTRAGTNLIEKTLNGCMIVENWSSAYGMKGKSINYYDPDIGKWRQRWVDDRGNVINYTAEFRDGAMHFTGENFAPDGTRELSRMKLEPLDDGTVHQFIEQSTDDGESWYVWFDAIYSPSE